MRRLLAGLVLLGVAAALPALARQQVLKNGSYETLDPNTADPNDPNVPLRPTFWNAFGGAVQSGDFFSHGDFSCLASVRTNAYVGMYQDPVSVGEGVRVLMKAMAYHPSTAPLDPNVVAGIKLEFFAPEGLEVPPPEENLAFDANSPSDQWVPISLTTTVPDGIDLAAIVLINFESYDPNFPLTNGPVYIELASAELSTDPNVNQLCNFSFEEGTSNPNGMQPCWIEFADPGSRAAKRLQDPNNYPALDGINVVRCLGATAGLKQTIPVTPGATLFVQAYFRSTSVQPWQDPNAHAGVKVEWVLGGIPTPNIDVAPNANPISGTTNVIRSTSPTDTWLPVTIDYTIPDNKAAKLRGTLITAFGPAVSDPYFDAFEMVLTNVFDGSDVDGDDDADLGDVAVLQDVFTGSGGGMEYLGLAYDHDEDSDVDWPDADYTLQRLTGPLP